MENIHSPEVSFVMPAYNVGKYIEEAIESVRNQTFPDWELIIIDDCSGDDTLEKAQRYAELDNRITVIRMKTQSGGAFIPRKEGIIRASSPVIAPLDADDFIYPDYLERMIRTKRKTGAEAVYPVIYRWRGSETELLSPPEPSLIENALPGPETVKFTIENWKIHCGGGLIDRDLYIRSLSELADSEIMSSHDEMLTRVLLYNARSVGISDTPYLYRDNPESITKQHDIRAFSIYINHRRLVEYIGARYPIRSEEYLKAQRHNFHGTFDALRLLPGCRLNKEEKRKVLEIIKENRRIIDYSLLKGKVSWKYLFLSRLPFYLQRILLRFL